MIAIAVAGVGAIPNVALAQETQSETVTDRNIIIVTARSREENIQDVPLAITAITAEEIEKRGIEGLADVAQFTAGFSFENLQGGNGSPTIRGQSQLFLTSREQTTATFFDGVYLPRSWLIDSGTNNLSRIEIVKGPQSARFGRNAFSGAINFIPNKADTSRSTGQASATYGNHDRFDVGGNFNIVLEEDIMAVAGSYHHSEFDGSWRNDHPFADAGLSPGTDGRVGGRDNQAYSLGFIIKPSDRVTIEAAYYGFERSEEAGASEYFNTDQGDGNCGRIEEGNFRLFCGELPVTGDTVTVEPRAFGRQSSADIVRANANFEFTDDLSFDYTLGFIRGDTISASSAESDQINCGTILAPTLLAGGERLCNFQASPLGSVNYTSHDARIIFDNRESLCPLDACMRIAYKMA